MNKYRVTWQKDVNGKFYFKEKHIEAQSKGQAYRIAVQEFNAVLPKVEKIG